MKTMEKQISWSPGLIKMLRGKRTQEEFGALLKIPKNTVWRWEAGQAKPTVENVRRLSALAGREKFLKDWKLEGSGKIVGDLEEGSRQICKMVEESFIRTARMLNE